VKEKNESCIEHVDLEFSSFISSSLPEQ
jgi:hypothetical protein